MEKKFTLGIIGAGNMASAILGGVLRGGLIAPAKIVMSDADPEKLAIAAQNGVAVTASNREVAENSEYLIFALKPQVAPVVFEEIAPVGEGMSAVTFSKGYRSQFVIDIFSSVGSVVELDESLFDAVTSVSGSGPAYVYMFIKAMTQGGVDGGLDAATAKTLAVKTVIGAAKLAGASPRPLDELIDAVCSKGGTTIEAVRSFREDGLEDIVRKGMAKCKKRSEELGNAD